MEIRLHFIQKRGCWNVLGFGLRRFGIPVGALDQPYLDTMATLAGQRRHLCSKRDRIFQIGLHDEAEILKVIQIRRSRERCGGNA